MARLGHVGYGMYEVGGITFVVSPTQSTIVEQGIVDHEHSVLLEGAKEYNDWIDHKINWSIIIYGATIGEDIQEGV